MTDLFIHLYAKRQNYYPLHNHKLEVYNYPYKPSKTFYDKDKIRQDDDFNTNQLRIAYATARTLCSYHLDDRELYFDIIASLLSHLNFITRNNSNNYLQIFESRYNRLRDFSKSTRIGELAQGINSLFVQEHLNYIYIVDFHYFYEKVYGIPFGKGSTPDFVVLCKNFKELALFESKGEGGKSKNINGKSGKLYGALEQLKLIIKPCAKKLIPICTRFENNNKSKNSAIHYSIINNYCTDSTTALRIFRIHYASWFYLVGDFNRANQLLEENGFENIIPGEVSGNIIYELGTDNKEQDIYWVKLNPEIDWLSKTLNFQLKGYIDLYFRNFKIGIYKSVVEQLVNNSLNIETETVITSDEEYQRFADRTIIRVGNNEQNS